MLLITLASAYISGFMMAKFENLSLPYILLVVSLCFCVLSFAAYTTLFLGKYEATIGKMIFKIKVVNSDGSGVSYPKALERHLLEYLSGIILFIGFFMAVLDKERRTLHDRICDTRVVGRREMSKNRSLYV